MKTTKVGLVGFGTIGTGVAKLLIEQQERISRRTNGRVELVRIADTDVERPRNVALPPGMLTKDYREILNDPEISLVVQLIGGTGVERTIMLEMLASGKNIVTANKALLATHGEEIFEAARKHGCSVAFEAAVGGGIPIIASLSEGLAANSFESIHAILNGTCNFILSSMEEEGSDYSSTLAEAQRLGYAEANPAMDVTGADTAQKLAILSHIAFGISCDWRSIPRLGIETVDAVDFRYAKLLGYSIKLLATAQRLSGAGSLGDSLALCVFPTLVSQKSPLSDVHGAFNAVSVVGDAVGHSFYYGLGAGELPTASAVVGDVIDTIIGRTRLTFETLKLYSPDKQPDEGIRLAASEAIPGRFYLRVTVVDQVGVMAEVANLLGAHGISIASLIQEENHASGSNDVPLIIITHETTEGALSQALEAINGLECVCGETVRMRIYG